MFLGVFNATVSAAQIMRRQMRNFILTKCELRYERKWSCPVLGQRTIPVYSKRNWKKERSTRIRIFLWNGLRTGKARRFLPFFVYLQAPTLQNYFYRYWSYFLSRIYLKSVLWSYCNVCTSKLLNVRCQGTFYKWGTGKLNFIMLPISIQKEATF